MLIETDRDVRIVSSDVCDGVENVLVRETTVGSLCEQTRTRKPSASTEAHFPTGIELERTEVEPEMAEAVTWVVDTESSPDNSSLKAFEIACDEI